MIGRCCAREAGNLQASNSGASSSNTRPCRKRHIASRLQRALAWLKAGEVTRGDACRRKMCPRCVWRDGRLVHRRDADGRAGEMERTEARICRGSRLNPSHEDEAVMDSTVLILPLPPLFRPGLCPLLRGTSRPFSKTASCTSSVSSYTSHPTL